MSDNPDTTPAGLPAGFTVIPVLYRDASNYKSYGDYHLHGRITPAQVEELAQTLLDGGDHLFIPAQIGEDHLNEWTPNEDDHPWHELGLDDLSIHDQPPSSVRSNQIDWTVTDFITVMKQAHDSGWDAYTYPYGDD